MSFAQGHACRKWQGQGPMASSPLLSPTPKSPLLQGTSARLPGWPLISSLLGRPCNAPRGVLFGFNTSSPHHFSKNCVCNSPAFTWHSKTNTCPSFKSPTHSESWKVSLWGREEPRLNGCSGPPGWFPIPGPSPGVWLSVQLWAHCSQHSRATHLTLSAALRRLRQLQTCSICRNAGF